MQVTGMDIEGDSIVVRELVFGLDIMLEDAVPVAITIVMLIITETPGLGIQAIGLVQIT